MLGGFDTMERHIFIAMTVILSICISCTRASVAFARPTELLKILQQVDRNMCRSMKLTCKTKVKKHSPKKHVTPAAKPVQAPAVAEVLKVEKAKSSSAALPEKNKVKSVPTPSVAIAEPVTPAKREAVAPAKVVIVIPIKKDPAELDKKEASTKANPVVPVRKPETQTRSEPAVATVKATSNGEETPLLPPMKPLRPVAILLPTPAIIPKIALPGDEVPDQQDASCLQQLRQVADYTIAADTVASGLCHVYNPVHLLSVMVQKQVIQLPEVPLLNCKYALQLSKWVRESAAPILSAQTGSPLEKISTGPGFQCRGRNGDSTAKVSEHGYGNAVDISDFRMGDGKDIIVKDAIDPNAANYVILHGLRSSACGYFTTVLGPGSNEAHAKHFHFDMGVHGKSGNYRICE